MLKRYRHLIWDWNGTLLDDLDLCIDIMNGILRRRGLPLLDRQRYHSVFDFPVRNYYAQLGLDTCDESFRSLSIEFISAYDQRRFEARLHPGAREILEHVVNQGITQSILSAYRQETLSQIVEHFDLVRFFSRVAGLDNVYAHSKAALGRSLVDQLRLPGTEVLMIGDTLHDLEVAAETGVDCVLIAHGHHPLDRLSARCPNVFANLAELDTALRQPPSYSSVGASSGGNR